MDLTSIAFSLMAQLNDFLTSPWALVPLPPWQSSNLGLLILVSLLSPSSFFCRFAEDLDEESGIALVRDAIRAGIFNDLGSGSNVDITVIRRGGEVSRFRTYENAAGNASDLKKQYLRPAKLTPPPGTTFVIEESFRPHKTQLAPLVQVPPPSTDMEVGA